MIAGITKKMKRTIIMPSEYPRLICVGRLQWLHHTGAPQQAPYKKQRQGSGGPTARVGRRAVRR